jgi:hypothetical protein
MEKLFAKAGIGLKQFVSDEGLDKYIAYTQQLINRDIFIEIQSALQDDTR